MTQKLSCGIGVAANPWPMKMAINSTESSWPQGRLSPAGPQWARGVSHPDPALYPGASVTNAKSLLAKSF